MRSKSFDFITHSPYFTSAAVTVRTSMLRAGLAHSEQVEPEGLVLHFGVDLVRSSGVTVFSRLSMRSFFTAFRGLFGTKPSCMAQLSARLTHDTDRFAAGRIPTMCLKPFWSGGGG